MTTPSYNVGSEKELTGTFTDKNGTKITPTAFVLTIREPDGTVTTKSETDVGTDITEESAGVLTYKFTIGQAGRHVVRWHGTAGTIASDEEEFYARRVES